MFADTLDQSIITGLLVGIAWIIGCHAVGATLQLIFQWLNKG